MEDCDVIRKVKEGDAEESFILFEKYHRQLLNFVQLHYSRNSFFFQVSKSDEYSRQ